MNTSYYPVAIRPRYAETDQMGIVHHAVYPVWFEAARSALARAVGMPYSRWEREGTLLLVSDLRVRFRQPAHYDEEIVVGVRVEELASRRIVFGYRVTRNDGTLLVEGETRHLVVDRSSGRPAVLPNHLREALLRDPGETPDSA